MCASVELGSASLRVSRHHSVFTFIVLFIFFILSVLVLPYMLLFISN